jgi:hypothetical protein
MAEETKAEGTKSRTRTRTSRPLVGFNADSGEAVALPEGTSDVRSAMAYLVEHEAELLEGAGVQLYRDCGIVRARAPKRIASQILVRE